MYEDAENVDFWRTFIENEEKQEPQKPQRASTPSSSSSEESSDDEDDHEKVKTVDISKWDSKDIYDWILSIDKERFGKYKDLKQTLEGEQLTGSDLEGITEQNLKEFGITKFSDKKLLFHRIQSILPKDKKAETARSTVCTTTKKVEDEDVPDQFLDPITYELMEDPVLCTKSGHTYERKTIELWIEENGADPVTRQKIKKKHLVPNRGLKDLIADWKRAHRTETE